ncbi:MAG: TIGR01777 family protein [Elusimicrobia bacterium]|nr:TIGR01777 family protein [Elusimicrobiota bacterium]
MRVLVAGGTGFIGKHLCRVLLSDGHQVAILSRTEKPSIENISRFSWNVPLESILKNMDAVVNLTGESLAQKRWSPKNKSLFRESRIQSTKKIVSAMAAMPQPPSVLVNASAVGYYGDRGEQILTEASPSGTGFLADLCKEWEAEALQAKSSKVRVVRLRTGLVLGKEGGALPRMIHPFKFFVGGPLGSGKQYVPWIHIEDVAGLIRFSLESEKVEGPLNVTAPQPIPNQEFCEALASVLRRPCLFRVPAGVLKSVLGELADLILGSQRAIP